jgi:two-component system cell cycle response regulator
MASILCVDPSASYRALVAQLAADSRVDTIFCNNTQDAFRHLDGPQHYALMIVANKLSDDETGVDLIRSTRLLANRATMPILFIMTDRDPDLAFSAMQAGATEVVLRSDSALLGYLINEFSSPLQGPAQTGRVLLVEDSESQADYVKQICVTLGLVVDRCLSVEEGIECLRQNDNYQIAVVDIVLQGMNSGLALVRHIRNKLPPPRSRLPTLVMSGFNDAARRIEALRIGADDFLNKPFSEEEFVWRLHRIIQASSGNGRENIKLHRRSEDTLAWQQLGLSLREIDVCKALIQGVNDKQIATDLHISFWTVRTHISSIFTKLEVLNRRELMARYLPGINK